MKLAELLAEASIEDLERLAHDHARTDESLSRGQLLGTIESVLRSHRFSTTSSSIGYHCICSHHVAARRVVVFDSDSRVSRSRDARDGSGLPNSRTKNDPRARRLSFASTDECSIRPQQRQHDRQLESSILGVLRQELASPRWNTF